MERQITATVEGAIAGLPGLTEVRSISKFGLSQISAIFEDGTDLYWARSRVLESLNVVSGRLPDGVNPVLGPDATGVGWVYEYALVDRTGGHDPQRTAVLSPRALDVGEEHGAHAARLILVADGDAAVEHRVVRVGFVKFTRDQVQVVPAPRADHYILRYHGHHAVPRVRDRPRSRPPRTGADLRLMLSGSSSPPVVTKCPMPGLAARTG